MKILKSAFLILLSFSVLRAQEEPPREWVDKDTGHRVVRLSDDAGSQSLYFHQNGYTASGDKMVFSTKEGLSVYNFKTCKVEPLVEGRVSNVIVGRKTRQVFYFKDDMVYSTNLDTRETRAIVKKPELRSGSGWGVNADETMLGGSRLENPPPPAAAPPPANTAPVERRDSYPSKGEMMERRLAARLPMTLYTINIKTGEVKDFYRSTDWLNHVQFSPTDPTLMMFCHEGPWHKVDRIWTIRTDGTGLRLMHKRTMEMEIAGHEFFSNDGKYIWYDLQTPKSKVFWLAGVEIKSGKQVRYKVERDEWSVH